MATDTSMRDANADVTFVSQRPATMISQVGKSTQPTATSTANSGHQYVPSDQFDVPLPNAYSPHTMVHALGKAGPNDGNIFVPVPGWRPAGAVPAPTPVAAPAPAPSPGTAQQHPSTSAAPPAMHTQVPPASQILPVPKKKRDLVTSWRKFYQSRRKQITSYAVTLHPEIVRSFQSDLEKKRVGQRRALEKKRKARAAMMKAKKNAKVGKVGNLRGDTTSSSDTDTNDEEEKKVLPSVPDSDAFDVGIRGLPPPEDWEKNRDGSEAKIVFMANLSYNFKTSGKVLVEGKRRATREGALEDLVGVC